MTGAAKSSPGYVERYRQGTNVVVLEPDVALVFPDAASVNEALRLRRPFSASRCRKNRHRFKTPTLETRRAPHRWGDGGLSGALPDGAKDRT